MVPLHKNLTYNEWISHKCTYFFGLPHVTEENASHTLDSTLLQFMSATFVITNMPVRGE